VIKILDRYIVRSFLSSALLLFVCCMALRVITDLFLNMDEFLEGDAGSHTAIFRIAWYYGLHSLEYVTQIGGVVIVLSAAFTLARMNHTNELTAMLASGQSLHRVVWPIVLCAMLLGGFIIIDQEFLMPPLKDMLARGRDDIAEGKERFPVRLMTDGNRTLLYSERLFPDEKRMQRPMFIFRDQALTQLPHVWGDEAHHVTGPNGSGWEIPSAVVGYRGGEKVWPNRQSTDRIMTTIGPCELLEKAIEVARGEGKRIPKEISTVKDLPGVRDKTYNFVISADRLDLEPTLELPADRSLPQDLDFQYGVRLSNVEFRFRHGTEDRHLCTIRADEAAWLPPKQPKGEGKWELTNGVLFYRSDLDIEEITLRQSSNWLDYMSTAELSGLLRLRRVTNPDTIRMVKHTRFTNPINNLVMLLLGLPFILSRERNIKASAGLCLLMVGTFYAFIYICRYMGLPPLLAAFLPILLFGPIAVVMLDSVKT